MKYFIKTFGCQANTADSERIAAALESRGMTPAKDIAEADQIVINTCMVRQSAENRVYGLINNLKSQNSNVKSTSQISRPKIILTGCMVGMAVRDKSGKMLQSLRKKLPTVDEFLPIEEVGFDTAPLRSGETHAWVPISNGCNNFCSYCVVPFTRGREVSRPYEEVIAECRALKSKGYREITLLGQNVNSYGADLMKSKVKSPRSRRSASLRGRQISKLKISGRELEPVYVKHLGRQRIPTLFPYLLEEVAQMDFERVDFLSSNPWDFSDELIKVIARNSNITRTIHLPVQSGDDEILKKMNRWYSRDEYLSLISKLKSQISNVKITTDIIVGFPGETEEQFQNTVKLCKKVGFNKAYIAMYSPRPLTASQRFMEDTVQHEEKRRRRQILEKLINA